MNTNNKSNPAQTRMVYIPLSRITRKQKIGNYITTKSIFTLQFQSTLKISDAKSKPITADN